MSLSAPCANAGNPFTWIAENELAAGLAVHLNPTIKILSLMNRSCYHAMAKRYKATLSIPMITLDASNQTVA